MLMFWNCTDIISYALSMILYILNEIFAYVLYVVCVGLVSKPIGDIEFIEINNYISPYSWSSFRNNELLGIFWLRN